jgi:hypothetical protein
VAYLSNQVEAKIARANRAFRLSSRIIVAARGELASHGAWLDRHATWAKEVKRHHRLLRRKLSKLALRRFVVGLLYAAPFALVRAIEAKLKGIATPASPQSRPAEPAPDLAERDLLQRRIGLVDGRSGAIAEDAPHAASQAAPAHVPAGRIAISPVGVVTLVLIAASGLIAAGAVHAMLSAPPAEAPALERKALEPRAVEPRAVEPRAVEPKALEPKALEPKDPEPRALKPTAFEPMPHVAASLTLAKTAEIERPAPLSGFAILPPACSPDALWPPPQTVADMMSMTRPLASEPMCPETAPASIAAEPLAPQQANKAKRKRTLAAREPEPLPWWQEWSWIRLR